MAAPKQQRSHWVAIITGIVSVLIGAAYLALITFLDARGPMRPPPPEALVGVVTASLPTDAGVPPPV